MKLSHVARRRVIIQTSAAEREGGFVLVMFAMLLIPLLLFVAFSVDVGSWYNRASDMQKAADAASLAGVIWLPDEDKAREVALETAKKNGFDNDDPNIEVTVAKSTKVPNRLQVMVRDRRVGSFIYSNIGGSDLDMHRDSFAEYVTPVPMGSPRNYFGTGPLLSTVPGMEPELLFQSINPFCTNKTNGDRHQSGYYKPATGNKLNECPGDLTEDLENTEHRSTGYELVIESPENQTSPIEVRLYDARYNTAGVNPSSVDEVWRATSVPNQASCPRASTGQYANGLSSGYCIFNTARRFNGPVNYWRDGAWHDQISGQTPTTNYVRLLAKGGPDSYLNSSEPENFTYTLFDGTETPLDDTDMDQICSRTFSRNTPFEYSYLGSPRWNTLCSIPVSPEERRYVLRVQNSGSSDVWADGSNQWGVVATYDGSLCDARTDALCPSVSGKEAISVYANTTQGIASFFLAEIGAQHQGKTLRLELWDPGEGGSSIEILQPSGPSSWAPVSLTWESPAPPFGVNDGNGNGPYSTSALSGSGTAINVRNSRFNGRSLDISVDLTSYTPSASWNNNWWKIRYTFDDEATPNVTDRTTWSARILGDPVHLIEE